MWGPVLRAAQRLRVLLRHRVQGLSGGGEGTLRTFSIVAHAAPGIPVPFVSGIIDCDGTSVRANVINTDPTRSRSSWG